jgi:hypothetical protein
MEWRLFIIMVANMVVCSVVYYEHGKDVMEHRYERMLDAQRAYRLDKSNK